MRVCACFVPSCPSPPSPLSSSPGSAGRVSRVHHAIRPTPIPLHAALPLSPCLCAHFATTYERMPRLHWRQTRGVRTLYTVVPPAHPSRVLGNAGGAEVSRRRVVVPPKHAPLYGSSTLLQPSSQSLSPQSPSAAPAGQAQLSCRHQGRRRRHGWALLCLSPALVVLVAMIQMLAEPASTSTSHHCGKDILPSGLRSRTATATAVCARWPRRLDKFSATVPPKCGGSAPHVSSAGDAPWRAAGAQGHLAACPPRDDGDDVSDADGDGVVRHVEEVVWGRIRGTGGDRGRGHYEDTQ